MKIKLLYITCDSWWDTDVSVIPGIAKDYDVEVYCTSCSSPQGNKYPIKHLTQDCIIHDCQYERSKKNLRMIIHSFFYGVRVWLASLGKTTFWVFDGNIYNAYLLSVLLSRRHTIISLHNYKLHKDVRSWERNMNKFLIKRFSYFHFQSPMQETLFKKDFPRKISFSTVMAVKDFGKPKRVEPFFNNGLYTFLFFGSIRDYKRPDLFIEASNKMNGKANFIIAGNSNVWEKYHAMIEKNNPILCDFRFIENDSIPDYYCNAHFIVLPYDDSTQSGPLLTAYNYNVPAVASSLPYFREMIDDNKTGFIFEQGNLDSLISVLEKASSMSKDQYDTMRRELEKKVDNYISNNSFVHSLNDFLNYYKI